MPSFFSEIPSIRKTTLHRAGNNSSFKYRGHTCRSSCNGFSGTGGLQQDHMLRHRAADGYGFLRLLLFHCSGNAAESASWQRHPRTQNLTCSWNVFSARNHMAEKPSFVQHGPKTSWSCSKKKAGMRSLFRAWSFNAPY